MTILSSNRSLISIEGAVRLINFSFKWHLPVGRCNPIPVRQCLPKFDIRLACLILMPEVLHGISRKEDTEKLFLQFGKLFQFNKWSTTITHATPIDKKRIFVMRGLPLTRLIIFMTPTSAGHCCHESYWHTGNIDRVSFHNAQRKTARQTMPLQRRKW